MCRDKATLELFANGRCCDAMFVQCILQACVVGRRRLREAHSREKGGCNVEVEVSSLSVNLNDFSKKESATLVPMFVELLPSTSQCWMFDEDVGYCMFYVNIVHTEYSHHSWFLVNTIRPSLPSPGSKQATLVPIFVDLLSFTSQCWMLDNDVGYCMFHVTMNSFLRGVHPWPVKLSGKAGRCDHVRRWKCHDIVAAIGLSKKEMFVQLRKKRLEEEEEEKKKSLISQAIKVMLTTEEVCSGIGISSRNSRQLDNILRQIPDTTKLISKIVALKEELDTSNNENKEALNNISNLAIENIELAWAKNNLKKLESYVLNQHEKGFNKALSQTAFLFNIDIEDEWFDIDKDVHNEALVPIVGIDSVEPSSPKVEKRPIPRDIFYMLPPYRPIGYQNARGASVQQDKSTSIILVPLENPCETIRMAGQPDPVKGSVKSGVGDTCLNSHMELAQTEPEGTDQEENSSKSRSVCPTNAGRARALHPLTTAIMPLTVEKYDGSGDPEEHLRVFSLSIKGEALAWFHSLRPRTVDNFETLRNLFEQQFAFSKAQNLTYMELTKIMQRKDEGMRDFMDCEGHMQEVHHEHLVYNLKTLFFSRQPGQEKKEGKKTFVEIIDKGSTGLANLNLTVL
ncbi:hypothetical protein V8G54_037398 [Vigna mungo]|uniref:Retrotransposon gag domain-containing protein n=1 Tax=Vigna mungo TaxID=3915 RepID=A0AAQ3MIH1_VIGMU